MGKSIDITGKKFGHLTAIRFDHNHLQPSGRKTAYWLFRCDCGREKIMNRRNIVRGRIKTCGCQQNKIKHGMAYTRIHKIWHGIKQRCLNKNNGRYYRYGARGIKICDEWRDDFVNFYKWAMEAGYTDELSIDRIDNDGNYCPENCRWITQKEQTRNCSKNRMITYNGETLCFSAMAEKYGVNMFTAHKRFMKGWPLDRVFKKVEQRNAINKI